MKVLDGKSICFSITREGIVVFLKNNVINIVWFSFILSLSIYVEALSSTKHIYNAIGIIKVSQPVGNNYLKMTVVDSKKKEAQIWCSTNKTRNFRNTEQVAWGELQADRKIGPIGKWIKEEGGNLLHAEKIDLLEGQLTTGLPTGGMQISSPKKKTLTMSKSLPTPDPAPAAAFATPALSGDTDFNADLVMFYERDEHYIIIPKNTEGYNYIFKYPFTSFAFLNTFNEDKIMKLTVKDFKRGSLDDINYYNTLSYNKIVGFEDMADKMQNMDEFEIQSMKKEIIGKLLDCYKKHRIEYNKFLKGINGTYTIRIGQFGQRKAVDDYPKSLHNTVKTAYISGYYVDIRRDSYNFDKKILSITTLAPHSCYQGSGWEERYGDKFFSKYSALSKTNRNAKFPKHIKVNLGIDDAKTIFGGNDKTYVGSILEIKLRDGYFGKFGWGAAVQDFDIKRIRKLFYRENQQWNNPTLIIDVESSRRDPLS